MKKDCFLSELGGKGKGAKDGTTLVKQQSTQNTQQKGDPSKKVKSFKCGGVGHIAEDSRLVTQLGAGLAKPASSSERVEEVVAGLFLTRLEKHPELKSSLSSMSG